MVQWRRQPGLHLLKLDPQGTPVALYVPSAAHADKPLPLIIALHWGGPMYPHKGRDFLGALVIPGMGEAGALIAAPDCPSESWTAPESEALVLAFVERMRQQGSIDPRRVALMGYSMGGIGAWHIASRNQERFSAAVILSARPLEAALRASWRIPLYLIHSRQDEVFPFSEVQSAVEKLRDAGAEVYFDLLDGLTHFQTHRFVKPLRRAADWLAARWGAATQSAPGEG